MTSICFVSILEIIREVCSKKLSFHFTCLKALLVLEKQQVKSFQPQLMFLPVSLYIHIGTRPTITIAFW